MPQGWRWRWRWRCRSGGSYPSTLVVLMLSTQSQQHHNQSLVSVHAMSNCVANIRDLVVLCSGTRASKIKKNASQIKTKSFEIETKSRKYTMSQIGFVSNSLNLNQSSVLTPKVWSRLDGHWHGPKPPETLSSHKRRTSSLLKQNAVERRLSESCRCHSRERLPIPDKIQRHNLHNGIPFPPSLFPSWSN